MDAPQLPLQSFPFMPSPSHNDSPIAPFDSNSNHSPPTFELPPQSNPTTDDAKKNKKKKKKKKRPFLDASDPQLPSSSSSSCSASHSVQRGVRVSIARRNPRILIASVRQKESDVEALALPLGMSIAAVVAQVLEKKETAGGRMSVDHLSMICSLAVRESLANVFGDKFDCFVSNFEKSFQSTLKTLRLINESSQSNRTKHLRHFTERSCCSDVTPRASFNEEGASACNNGGTDCQSELVLQEARPQEQVNTLEDVEENMQLDLVKRQLALHHGQTNQQLACVSSSTLLGTLEKSVMEQTRSNDLRTYEIGLTMKKLRLKETQLALNSDLNLLERCKLSMGISKASFKAEKFKNQLEDTRHAELLRTCIDCLVAGLLIMLGCLAYGAYVYSHKRITEATASCTPTSDSKSWWIPKPMASFNSGLHVLRCQVQVVSRMVFGALMILAIAYLLLQRSATSKQTMPVTFLILLLGVACGFAGKFCIDTLGGSGNHWLFYWEAMCSLHFFSNVCTSFLFLLLYGPITVSQGTKSSTIFPYWMRRFLFYATVLMVLPLLCGFMPFASLSEWRDHFSLLIVNFIY